MGTSTGQISQFPSGFLNGVAIRGMPILQTHPGNVFWVYNGAVKLRGQSDGSNQNKGDFNHPFSTLTYAISQCQAGNGDVIFIKPGHIETLTAAAGVAHSTAGVTVIGLGNYNLRPKFLLGTVATTTYLVSATDANISNLWMVGNFSNVATAFNVTAKGCTIDNCRFTNAGTNLDFLACVSATGAANTADGLTVTNCNWTTIDTDDFGMVKIAAACNDVTIWNNHMVTTSAQVGAAACANLVNCTAGAVLLNADIGWNRVQNLMPSNEVLVFNDGTTNTGFVHNNYIQCADVTGVIDLGADVTGFGLFENYVVTTNALSGFLLPAADVNN